MLSDSPKTKTITPFVVRTCLLVWEWLKFCNLLMNFTLLTDVEKLNKNRDLIGIMGSRLKCVKEGKNLLQ